MITRIALCLFVILAACQMKPKNSTREQPTNTFYVGTYTEGESEGIYKYELLPDGTMRAVGLVAKSENPSFLAKSSDGRYLVAVNEIQNEQHVGSVESWKITEDSLTFISRSSSGGAHPCHVSLNTSGYILTANYTGGNVGLLKIDKSDGRLSDLLDLQQHSGQGSTDRQQGPHAHSAWFVPESDDVMAIDLGTNELWFSELDQKQGVLTPRDPQKLAMTKGAGPRHLTFHPNNNWVYVINELDCTVSLVKKDDAGTCYLQTSVSTLPKGYDQPNYCADIHVTQDGQFLYASNRGHNSIAIFSINKENGALASVGHPSTRGDFPRNFALSPDGDYLLVANQKSNNIVSFHRNKETGSLTFVDECEAPTPVCILF